MPIIDKLINYTLLYLWAEIVQADLVMGRNYYGPKLLWAEMSSDHLLLTPFVLRPAFLIKLYASFLVQHYSP